MSGGSNNNNNYSAVLAIYFLFWRLSNYLGIQFL